MKKLALFFILLIIAASCSACSEQIPADPVSSTPDEIQSSAEKPEAYKMALITPPEELQGYDAMTAWQGIVTYGDSTSRNYKYYAADNLSTAAGITTVKTAVENGAEIVILPSPKYKNIAYSAQTQFPHTGFLLVGAMPTEESEASSPEISIEKNVHCIYFKEEQLGYLAGYCAVMDGWKALAYVGDSNDETNMRYLYGFIRGADDAAAEKKATDVAVKYVFTDSSEANAQSAAKGLYDKGVQVIFSCNEELCKGIAAAAEKTDNKLITGRFAGSDFGDVQLAAVVFNANEAIELSLSAFYGSGGTWAESAAGKALRFGIENGCITLSGDESTWNFSKIDKSTVDNVANMFINNEVNLSSDVSEPVKTKTVKYSEFNVGDDS